MRLTDIEKGQIKAFNLSIPEISRRFNHSRKVIKPLFE